MEPFEIELTDIHAENSYFRALYCKAESGLLLETCHRKALEMFNAQDINVYIPHLSLYYGNLPQSTKGEMVASLLLPTGMKFLADRIYLYRTEGGAQDWVRTGEYLLNK